MDGEKELAGVKCPVCKKETAWRDNPFRPFCSERCRLIDLGKWAADEYRIAGDRRPGDDRGEPEKKPRQE